MNAASVPPSGPPLTPATIRFRITVPDRDRLSESLEALCAGVAERDLFHARVCEPMLAYAGKVYWMRTLVLNVVRVLNEAVKGIEDQGRVFGIHNRHAQLLALLVPEELVDEAVGFFRTCATAIELPPT